MVLLPPPEGPTRPTESPCDTLKVTDFNTCTSARKGYANFTCSNSTVPTFLQVGMVPVGVNPSISDSRSKSLKRSWQATFALPTSPMNPAKLPMPKVAKSKQFIATSASRKVLTLRSIRSPAHQNPSANTKKVTAWDSPKLAPANNDRFIPAFRTGNWYFSTSPSRFSSAPVERTVLMLLQASEMTWVASLSSSELLWAPTI
mmetsp:Transcript_37102/g.89269  ORF Transcript_37102/g.89269 Transcript_37102/m.89269 type:complete len:202 (+) Transcript_37102:657-1262(+)